MSAPLSAKPKEGYIEVRSFRIRLSRCITTLSIVDLTRLTI
jgi:hypothetical protein